jgi:L-threonylcarbamoyladenylate synthase
VTGGQPTVALRIPRHPLALELLNAWGEGLVAPSANRFGRISPTSAAHVKEELGDAVAVVLDGGPCDIGIESTILDVSGSTPVLLRPGVITASQLSATLHCPISTPSSSSPRAPGMLVSHYAPRTATRLIDTNKLATLMHTPELTGLLHHTPLSFSSSHVHAILLPNNPLTYAQALYASLRELDHRGLTNLCIERTPASESWFAIYDRITRASH